MSTPKQDCIDIFRAGVAGVQPFQALQRTLRLEDHVLVAGDVRDRRYDLNNFRRVMVVGFGKASPAMAAGLETILGDRITGGVVIGKRDFLGDEMPHKIKVLAAGHPEPDGDSVSAATEVVNVLTEAQVDDLVIVLVSGGASALYCRPVEGVPLEDMQHVTRSLLSCGAAIDEINAVRKHLSAVKGGQSARLANPATVLELSISDVVGDAPGIIGSGPFAADESTFTDARAVLRRYDLWPAVPSSVRTYLAKGCRGEVMETPGPGQSLFDIVHRVFCGNNASALQAAAGYAADRGYNVHILPDPVIGEAREGADRLIATAEAMSAIHPTPLCLLAGGETTVTLTPQAGEGGRNQEFALAAAFALAERPDMVVLSAGTDGNDGTTDAAGAIVDATTISRGQALGMDPEDALVNHNAHPLFQALGDLVITGPTGTNVMDIQVVLVF